MKVVAGYLLALLGGNKSPSSEDVKSILGSVGIDVDDQRLELFMSQVEGRDIEEIMALGRQKLASVPSAGGACVSVAADGAATGDASDPVAESKPEKVEDHESDDDGIGMNLFDD